MSNEKRHSGRIAIITGAARGIGLATVERLAEDGASIVAFDLRGSPLGDAIGAAEARGARAVAFEGDVSLEADWQRAIDVTLKAFGRVDILFNNAGISGDICALLDYPEAMFDRVMAVNVRGVFLGTKYAGAAMKERGGAIVNNASITALSGGGRICAYTTSKHAVLGLTRAAAIEFARYKIRVNAVCPSPVDTEMMAFAERTAAPDHPETARAAFARANPLGRYSEPQEIAAVVSFLASDEASYVNGVSLPVDGGALAR